MELAAAATNNNNIQILLAAAEYLERKDRGEGSGGGAWLAGEAEHGYASMPPSRREEEEEEESSRKRLKTRKAPSIRSTHNELEKNRRAQLRVCLERLKNMVPLGPECSRHTTLGLLTKAKNHIKRLEEQERRAQQQKDKLEREHRYLRRRLEQLEGSPTGVAERLRTDSLGSALSSEHSDSDREDMEVDVESVEFSVGEGDSLGTSSDSDERSSLQSSSTSDGGYSSSSLKHVGTFVC
ncbi:max dimerization protein 4 isoform X1 [Petromyzon marinus]|uniref:Max-interacting protein 1-like isoform X1 n=1 Tax=Petromyzon marinus TaxID=7757 RepID=A0AAJ7WQ79_PETMA|nr:max-interacting protein 1-like isoform X1 [Petromyzon marinus]